MSSILTKQRPTAWVELGREITIPADAKATINEPGFTKEFHVRTVEVIIGIGKDHTASLVMDVEAWKALETEKISVISLKAFEIGPPFE